MAAAGREIEFVPLTDELRERFKLKGPMKAVGVFMVVRVEFIDGSVYSNEQLVQHCRSTSKKSAQTA